MMPSRSGPIEANAALAMRARQTRLRAPRCPYCRGCAWRATRVAVRVHIIDCDGFR